MTRRRIRTILEASLHDEPLLVFETGLGEMAEPRHIESRPDVLEAHRRLEPRPPGRWLHGRALASWAPPSERGAKRTDGPGARAPPCTRYPTDGAGSGGYRVGDAPHGVPRCGPVPVHDGGRPRAGAGTRCRACALRARARSLARPGHPRNAPGEHRPADLGGPADQPQRLPAEVRGASIARRRPLVPAGPGPALDAYRQA